MDEDTTDHFSLVGWFEDIDIDDVLSYTAETDGPIEMKINADLIMSVTPAANWSGQASINVTVSDGFESVTDVLKIVVENVNDAPHSAYVELQFVEATVGDIMLATASAEDSDLDFGDKLFFAWFSNISGKIGEGETMDLSLVAGHHFITMTVSDREGKYIHHNFEVSVKALPINETPVDDDDDETSENKNPAKTITIIAIAVPLIVLILVIAGLLLIFIKKQREATSEETNPIGINPPVD